MSFLSCVLSLFVATGVFQAWNVTLRDVFGNVVRRRGELVSAQLYRVVGANYLNVDTNITFQDEMYVGQYYGEIAGPHVLSITLDRQHIFGSPFTLTVAPGEVAAGSCEVFQASVLDIDAALEADLFLDMQGSVYGGQPNSTLKIIIIAKVNLC